MLGQVRKRRHLRGVDDDARSQGLRDVSCRRSLNIGIRGPEVSRRRAQRVRFRAVALTARAVAYDAGLFGVQPFAESTELLFAGATRLSRPEQRACKKGSSGDSDDVLEPYVQRGHVADYCVRLPVRKRATVERLEEIWRQAPATTRREAA